MIVAPAAQTALSLQLAAARQGTALVNVESVSVNGVALHIWRSMHPASAARLVTGDTMVLVLARALGQSRIPEAGLMRTSLSSLVSAIREDRMAGRDAAWAARVSRSGAQQVYAELFLAYERFLQDEGRLDLADIHQLALSSLDRFEAERTLDLLLLCSDVELLPVQEELLGRLAGMAGKSVLLQAAADDPELRPRTAGVLFPEWEGANEHRPAAPETSRVLQAATRREEVLHVLTDMLERGVPFDDVELAPTDPNLYVPVIGSLASRLGIPTTLRGMGGGEPRIRRRVLSAYLNWIASGYEARHLADLLRMEHLRVTSGLAPSDLAAMLDHFRVRPAALSRPDLRQALMEGAKRKRLKTGHVHAFLDWMTAFRTWVPDAEMPPRRFADQVDRFLDVFVGDAPGKDEEQGSLERLLDPMRAKGLGAVDAAFLADWLNKRIQEETQTGRDSGNGIHVVPLHLAGYGSRRHLFVLGMDDQAASAVRKESRHIMGLDAAAPEGYGAAASCRDLVEELASRMGDGLVLSAPAWDVTAARPLFPSSALVARSKVEKILPARRTQGLDAADHFRWYPWTQDPATFQPVRDGLGAMEARFSPEWTEHDGLIGQASAADGQPPTFRMSPSRVETFLSCPYRFFLSEILGLRPVDQADDEWIDRATEGNILHDLFEAHTNQRIAGQADVDAAAESNMMDALREALHRQVIRSGEAVDALVEARFRLLAHGVRQYFRRERALVNERTPVHAEFAFSDHRDADAPAVEFERAQGKILLTGRIDRIDRLEDGRWAIVDYKSGKPDAFLPELLAKLDGKLQWALYAWAAARAAGVGVSVSEYVFTSRSGGGWVSQIAAPANEQVEPLLEQVLERAASGHFIPAPEKDKNCTWCDFKSVCGDLDARKAAIQAKFEVETEDATRAYAGWTFREKARKGRS